MVILQIIILIAMIIIHGLIGALNAKYPPTLRCYAVTEQFGSSKEEIFEPLKEYAKHDKEDTLNMEGRGYYQCFC